MSDWTKNLISYMNNGSVGICPYCSSEKVEVENIGKIRQSLIFKCLNCNKSEHFDGLRIEK
jgi:hypothetical protein